MFRIGDLSFEVREATLDAFIRDDEVLVWGVEIAAAQQTVEGRAWAPRVTCDSLASTEPGDLGRWTDLAGREINWQGADVREGEARATLHVFRAEPVCDSHVKLGRSDSDGLSLEWSATCSVDGRDLGLEIRTEPVFRGIWFGKEPESDCRAALASFLSVDDFEITKTPEGVYLMAPKLTG